MDHRHKHNDHHLFRHQESDVDKCNIAVLLGAHSFYQVCIIASLLITLTKLILSLAELLDRQMTHCWPFHEHQSPGNLAEFGVQPASLSGLVYQAILEVEVHHGLSVHRISLCVCSRTKQAWIISSYTRVRRFQHALKDAVSSHQHPQRYLQRRLPYLWQ